MPKRASLTPASGAKPAKAAKPSGAMLQVAKGLAATDLPNDARDMLENMLGKSLEVYKEKRDKFQSKVVDLAEGVFSAHAEALKTKLEESEAAVAEFVKQGDEMACKITDKDGEVQEKHTDVVAKKKELAEAAAAFWAAKGVLDEAAAKVQTQEVEAQTKVSEKELLTSLRTDFLAHTDGGPAGPLVKRIEGMGANESMVMALPAMLAKPADTRGSFDAMVFNSVKEWLDLRIGEADEAISQAEPTKAANAEALEKADAAFQETKTQQLSDAVAYWKVRGEEEALEGELRALRQSSRKQREAQKKQATASWKAQQALDAFKNGPNSAFDQLRDRVEEVAGPAGEAAEAAEAAAEVEGAGGDAAEAAATE